jgi:hypothetical protein
MTVFLCGGGLFFQERDVLPTTALRARRSRLSALAMNIRTRLLAVYLAPFWLSDIGEHLVRHFHPASISAVCVGGACFCAMNPFPQISAAGGQSESRTTAGSIHRAMRGK